MSTGDADAIIAANQYHPNVIWRLVPGKGRAVFARRPLTQGEIVEWAPMSLFPAACLPAGDHRDNQMLHHVFTWGSEKGRENAYGWGLMALYNHSDEPNVAIEDGPIPDSMAVIALRDIAAGEELCHDYGYVWFEQVASVALPDSEK